MSDINDHNSKPWYFKLHWQVLFALVAGVSAGMVAALAGRTLEPDRHDTLADGIEYLVGSRVPVRADL